MHGYIRLCLLYFFLSSLKAKFRGLPVLKKSSEYLPYFENTLEVIKHSTASGLKQVDGTTSTTAPLPSGCQHSWKHQLPRHATRSFPGTRTLTVCPTGPRWQKCTNVAPNNLGINKPIHCWKERPN